MLTSDNGETITDHRETGAAGGGAAARASKSVRSVIGHVSTVGQHLHAAQESLHRPARVVNLAPFEPGSARSAIGASGYPATGRWFLPDTPRTSVNIPADVPDALTRPTTAPVLLRSSDRGGHKRSFPELTGLVRSVATPGRQAIIGQRERYDFVHLAPPRSGGG